MNTKLGIEAQAPHSTCGWKPIRCFTLDAPSLNAYSSLDLNNLMLPQAHSCEEGPIVDSQGVQRSLQRRHAGVLA